MKILEFYTSICDMLDIKYRDDALFIEHQGAEFPYLIGGKQVFLPTQNTIATMTNVVNGEVEVVKELFNPLYENVKGQSKSFNKFKYTMELKLTGIIVNITQYLLMAVANGTKDDNLTVSKFANLITKGIRETKSKSKTPISQKTVNKWASLYKAVKKDRMKKKYLQLKIIRNATMKGAKYTRVGTIEFPIAELLSELKEKETLLDVSISKLDISNFLAIFELMSGSRQNTLDGIQFGSLNNMAPSMHTLLLMYANIKDVFADIIETMLNDDEVTDDVKDEIRLKDIPIDMVNIASILNSMEGELKTIPTTAVAVSMAEKPQVIKTGILNDKNETKSFLELMSGGTNEPIHTPVVQSTFPTTTAPPIQTTPQHVVQVATPVVTTVQPAITNTVSAATSNFVKLNSQQTPQMAAPHVTTPTYVAPNTAAPMMYQAPQTAMYAAPVATMVHNPNQGMAHIATPMHSMSTVARPITPLR